MCLRFWCWWSGLGMSVVLLLRACERSDLINSFARCKVERSKHTSLHHFAHSPGSRILHTTFPFPRSLFARRGDLAITACPAEASGMRSDSRMRGPAWGGDSRVGSECGEVCQPRVLLGFQDISVWDLLMGVNCLLMLMAESLCLRDGVFWD